MKVVVVDEGDGTTVHWLHRIQDCLETSPSDDGGTGWIVEDELLKHQKNGLPTIITVKNYVYY